MNLLLTTVAISIAVTDSAMLFVSKTGTDEYSCGNETNPCGTLYKVSMIINEFQSANTTNASLNEENTFEIYIIDGQNEAVIDDYLFNDNTSNMIYDPCIPMPFDSSYDIIITFNPETIIDMTDWFPYDACSASDDNVTVYYDYKNEYLFDGGKSLTISNLIINDYIITNESYDYPFIRNTAFNGSVICENCTFRDITSQVQEEPLIYTYSKLHLIWNQFINVESIVELIYADHGWIKLDAFREIIIEKTSFINMVNVAPLIYLIRSNNDAGNLVDFRVMDCNFENIYTDNAIIYDESIQTTVTISNINVDIVSGLIYTSQHLLVSYISIHNVSVVSDQLNTVHPTGYFSFNHVDITDIEYMEVKYVYNMTESCSYDGTLYNEFLNATCDQYVCGNPMKIIENNGEIYINHLSLDMNISSVNSYTHTDTHYYQFNYKRNSIDDGFILNTGTMDLQNVYIYESTCSTLIINQNELSITNLIYDPSRHMDHDPNVLQAQVIIYHWGSETVTQIKESHLIGGGWQLFAIGGDVQIFNSTMERTGTAMQIRQMNSFIMDGCIVKHIGRYNGIFKEDIMHDTYVTAGIQMFNEPSNVVFINNDISGFDPKGLAVFATAVNAVFMNNRVNIDPTGLFYDVWTERHIHTFHWQFAAVLFALGVNTTVIGNTFEENYVQADNPWVSYYQQEGTNCLSGNIFTNAAIEANETDLTSCARTDLINYIQSDSNTTTFDENTHVYGFIDATILQEIGYFIIDETLDIDAIIIAEESNIALDNVNITNAMTVWGDNGNILLVDSYITSGNDILYDADICGVITNHRLYEETEYIAKLLIQCDGIGSNDEYIQGLSRTMDAEYTRLVDHMSAVAISIVTDTTYYPGQLMKIEYNVMDLLGNTFAYNESSSEPNTYNDNASISMSHDIVFQLQGTSFTTAITIDTDGTCAICESGVLINTVSINRDIDGILSMNISVMSNILYSLNSELNIPIIGCPIGYGPDLNNASCIQCNTDYYNLIENNIQFCKTCHSDDNDAVKCMDGKVHVAQDSWMGFHPYTKNIISAVCPSQYCCQSNTGCTYNNDNTTGLCALGRDHESTLCGRCKDGYSEAMNSAKCIECKRDYPEYIFFPFLLAICTSIFLLLISLDRNTPKKKEDYPQRKIANTKCKALFHNQNFKLMLKTMILKNIFYYEQSVSQLIITSPYKILLRPFAANFNFSLTSIVSYNDSLCFIRGLNAKWKILSDLSLTFMVIILIIILYILSKYKYILKSVKRINFAHAFITMYLIVIGKVLDVLLRLMSCQKVGDFHVHFFFGNEICYRSTWWIAFVVLSVIVISFTVIFTKLYLLKSEKRQNRSYTLYRFTVRYKPQYYYWEYVIFWRRILIALFAVSVQDLTLKFLFIAILMLFLYLQIQCDPFLIHEANKMEIILLIALVFVAATKISDVINVIVVNLLLSLLIILPIPLLIYYIYCSYHVQDIGKRKKSDSRSKSDSIDDTGTPVGVVNITHQEMMRDNAEIEMEHNINTEIKMSTYGGQHHVIQLTDSDDESK